MQYIVNVWSLDGKFVLGGIFNSATDLANELHIEVTPMMKSLFAEKSRFGIPDYVSGYEISVRIDKIALIKQT